MEIVKKSVSTIKSNLIGGIAGGVVTFLAAKKYGKVENKFALAALTIAGIVAGATVQAKIAAKKSAPTAQTVK